MGPKGVEMTDKPEPKKPAKHKPAPRCAVCERSTKDVTTMQVKIQAPDKENGAPKDKAICAPCASQIARYVMQLASKNPALAAEFGIQAQRKPNTGLINPATGRPFN